MSSEPDSSMDRRDFGEMGNQNSEYQLPHGSNPMHRMPQRTTSHQGEATSTSFSNKTRPSVPVPVELGVKNKRPEQKQEVAVKQPAAIVSGAPRGKAWDLRVEGPTVLTPPNLISPSMNLVPGEMSSEESEFDVEENRERLNSLLSAPPPIREPGLEPCSFRYPKCQELGTTDKNKENLHRAHSYSKLRSVASQSSLSRIENGIVSRKNSMDMLQETVFGSLRLNPGAEASATVAKLNPKSSFSREKPLPPLPAEYQPSERPRMFCGTLDHTDQSVSPKEVQIIIAETVPGIPFCNDLNQPSAQAPPLIPMFEPTCIFPIPGLGVNSHVGKLTGMKPGNIEMPRSEPQYRDSMVYNHPVPLFSSKIIDFDGYFYAHLPEATSFKRSARRSSGINPIYPNLSCRTSNIKKGTAAQGVPLDHSFMGDWVHFEAGYSERQTDQQSKRSKKSGFNGYIPSLNLRIDARGLGFHPPVGYRVGEKRKMPPNPRVPSGMRIIVPAADGGDDETPYECQIEVSLDEDVKVSLNNEKDTADGKNTLTALPESTMNVGEPESRFNTLSRAVSRFFSVSPDRGRMY